MPRIAQAGAFILLKYSLATKLFAWGITLINLEFLRKEVLWVKIYEKDGKLKNAKKMENMKKYIYTNLICILFFWFVKPIYKISSW